MSFTELTEFANFQFPEFKPMPSSSLVSKNIESSAEHQQSEYLEEINENYEQVQNRRNKDFYKDDVKIEKRKLSLLKKDRSKLISFLTSEFLFGVLGMYLSGAVKNKDWDVSKWQLKNDSLYPTIARGGLDGVITPFAFYYSSEVIGLEATIFVAQFGAYLGASAANKDWDLEKWNLDSQQTYNGAFKGLQDCVWLIDDLYEIYYFTERAKMGKEATALFIVVAYAIGGALAWAYLGLENGGNLNFWEWDLTSPVTIYGIVRGFHMGTRLPVGFGEIGLEVVEAMERAEAAEGLTRPGIFYDHRKTLNFIYNFTFKRIWMWLGGIFTGLIYVSVDNESFDLTKIGSNDFGHRPSLLILLESFLNGFMFGKDMEEYVMEVTNALQ